MYTIHTKSDFVTLMIIFFLFRRSMQDNSETFQCIQIKKLLVFKNNRTWREIVLIELILLLGFVILCYFSVIS
jgi:hypothetical protein